MTSIIAYLSLITVTIHISTLSPTPKDPKHYELASCSGVFISNNEVLTAGHCFVQGRNHQWVMTDDNKVYKAKIEKVDFKRDLAVIRLVGIKKHSYAVFGTRKVHRGDHVVTLNSGNDLPDTFNEGVISNLVIEEGVPMIMHTASIDYGASGSGLYDTHRNLIGLNVLKDSPFAYAVYIDVIREFLTEDEDEIKVS